MSARFSAAVALAAALLAGGWVGAHVRLVHPTNGSPLYWQNPDNITVVIQATGSDDLPNGSHATALRNAMAAWNAVAGSVARLVEDTNPLQQARTDFQSQDIRLLMFDEANTSGYFPPASSVVAITPVWFFSNGRIADADVLFNGANFAFTTSKAPGKFDVQDVGAHELGHLLGLDHSGWGGATMYPYVDPTILLHRSLSSDDEGGLRAAYPLGSFATIAGRVERSDGSGVAGAHVVALGTDGRPRGGILTNSSGNFTMTGLEGGTYTLYAAPLDGPVTAGNLSGGQTVHTDFQPTWWSSQVTVAAGSNASAGTVVVAPDVSLNLGRASDRLPLRAIRGSLNTVSLRGTDLWPGCTLTTSDPTLTVFVQSWLGSSVVFRVLPPANSPPGHADVIVENASGHRALVTAAIEVTPADPVVSQLSPASGPGAGGTTVTLTGTGFRAGARVVLGPRIYVDGEPGGCVVVSPTSIQLVTAPTPAGQYDVVVIDETGVEGRALAAFTIAETPVVASVFPAAGSAGGGTHVTLTGTNFAPQAVVRLDGVVQPDVQWQSATSLRFVTLGGLPGGPYVLEVENPGGHVAQAAFALVAAPDPEVSLVEPNIGPTSGGSTVTILGTNFTSTSEVVFGAHPATGQGGTPATLVSFVDSRTLAVITPPGSAGPKSVLVRAADTGQAAVTPGGYQYQSSGKGGGGGCSTRIVGDEDPGSGGAFAGTLLLVAIAWLLARRAERRLAPAFA
jgi:hypothetical protein